MRFDQFMRRECLVRVLIFGESHLRQILSTYAAMRSAQTLLWTKTRLWVERRIGLEPFATHHYVRI
jgi:hypothetical protein